jgi:hypothetical protein
MLNIEEQEAEYGERMIEIKVRFWTNDITEEVGVPRGKGKIRPKHAWGSGVVRIKRNRSHSIEPSKTRPFNSMMELSAAIEQVLIDHGIKIHRSRKMKQYAPTPEAEAGRRERALAATRKGRV